MGSHATHDSLKQKIKEKEILAYYFKPENIHAYHTPLSTIDDQKFLLDNYEEFSNLQIKCLYTIPYEKLSLQVGFPKSHEIEAGKDLSQVVHIEKV